jgi:hypothetical protein
VSRKVGDYFFPELLVILYILTGGYLFRSEKRKEHRIKHLNLEVRILTLNEVVANLGSSNTVLQVNYTSADVGRGFEVGHALLLPDPYQPTIHEFLLI